MTQASTLTCQSKGVVTPTAVHRLTVAGTSVLTAADVVGLFVTGCLKPEQTRCRQVMPPVGGSATRLTMDGVPVLTTTGFTAATGGVGPPVPQPVPPEPPGPGKLRAVANQRFLTGE
ncbi:hypothetical protein [Streptomyces lydicus]|uniref:hypothetical protein n=1 Tax=Streptomyces lydicus TaxID=47763 RepID=UPI00378B4C18